MWSGPGGFTANTAHAQTGTPGLYTLTVTDPTNGCSNSTQLSVIANKTLPANVTATNSGPLTCDITQVTITGTSTSPNVEYEWDGPNGYLSFSAQDVASDPGDYVLTVTNDDNGCVLLDTTTVVNNCNARKITSPVADTPAVAAAGNVFVWKAYPNPVIDKANIEFRSPETSFVTVSLFNNNGITEKLLFSSEAVAGQWYKLSLNERLPAGLHYLVIRVNDKMYTGKLISVQ